MKKIIFGISSSVSIYKSCEVIRRLVHQNFDVHTVMTENATELIRPLLFESLTGNPCFFGTFRRDAFSMKHIELKRDASLFVIAPASANVIGKCAHGIADDLLTTTFLAVESPVIMAPAMNPAMWNNAAVQQNISILVSRGVEIVQPGQGTVACGDEGRGKLATVEEIVERINAVIK